MVEMTEAQMLIQIDDTVAITCSGEVGIVIGVAVYPSAEAQALVRYMAGDGRAVEQWWNLSALTPLATPDEAVEQSSELVN
jgi:hypothetical protein